MAKIIDFKLKEFTPKAERTEEKPLTWFYCEPDFGMQRMQATKQKFKMSELKAMRSKNKDKIAEDIEIDFDFFDQQRKTIAYCLRAVTNLSDTEGHAIVIPSDLDQRANLVDRLPRDMMFELYHFITTGEDLEEETEEDGGEIKND